MVQKRTTIQGEHRPLRVTSGVKKQFQEIARWALILSAISFIIITFVLLAATYSSISMGFLRGGQAQGQLSPLMAGTGYLIVGALMLIPVLAIYKFSRFLKKALTDEDQNAMDEAFVNLKGGLRYSGLAIIAVLLFAMVATYVFPFFT